jgi:hypothetical protein
VTDGDGVGVLSRRGIVRALTSGHERGDLGRILSHLPNGSELIASATGGAGKGVFDPSSSLFRE